MWMIVSPAEDHHIFYAPCNKQSTIMHKSKIAGTQECACPTAAQRCLKSPPRLLRAIPVPSCYIRARHPNLAYFIRRALAEGLRVNDDYVILDRHSTTYERLRVAAAHGQNFNNSVLCDGCRLKQACIWTAFFAWHRHQ